MKTNKWLATIMMITLFTLLAACSSSGQVNEISIEVKDEFSYSPDSLTVKAGETYTLSFENTGTIDHTFNILKSGAELDHLLDELGQDEHVDEELILDIHEIAPGESRTVTFQAHAEAGEYTFVCLVPGHADSGMVGTLTVSP